MTRILIAILALIAFANPANAGARKPLVLSATGQVQPIQASDILVVELPRSGSLTSNFNYLFNPQALGVWASSDNQASGTSGTNIPSLFSVEHYFGGSNVDDGRNALGVALHQTAPTKSTNPYRFYAAGNFVFDSSFNEGGISGTPQGFGYGLGGVCRLKSGATFWQGCIPGDFEIAVEAGASSNVVAVVAALAWPEHAVHGVAVDVGYWLSEAAGAAHFYNGIQIDDNAGQFPVDTTGTILKVAGAGTPTVSHGLDLRGVHVANFLLAGDGVISTTSTAAATSTTTGALRVSGGLGVGGAAFFGAPAVLPSYAVSGLPTCNSGLAGGIAYVTDATSPTYNASLTGGGAVKALAMCNGSAWTAH